MRRIFASLLTCASLLALALPGLSLTGAASSAQAQSSAQPPHAFLFGTWTGGLFPAPSSMTAEACLSQPVVVFTRDLVLRATLTEQTYIQRVIATARATSGGFEIAFQPAPQAPNNPLLGLTSPTPPVGFGCPNPDMLNIQRRGENEISFPGCSDFPYPLVRCPNR